MNEDFDSNDIGNNSSNNRMDTELQVRLMNLVMGEASDFERDQLQTLMEERADVAAYYQHLEHLHGLLCEVGTGELSLDAAASEKHSTWRLSTDRRDKLLAILDGEVQNPSPTVELASSSDTKPKNAMVASLDGWTGHCCSKSIGCAVDASAIAVCERRQAFR
jgi:hypothetical protein